MSINPQGVYDAFRRMLVAEGGTSADLKAVRDWLDSLPSEAITPTGTTSSLPVGAATQAGQAVNLGQLRDLVTVKAVDFLPAQADRDAVRDGTITTDVSAALIAGIQAVKSRIKRVSRPSGSLVSDSSTLPAYAGAVIDFGSGLWPIGSALPLYPGVAYVGARARLQALTAGMTMAATETGTATGTDFNGLYGSNGLHVRGLLLDGAGLASVGVRLDTIAACSFSDVTAFGCARNGATASGTATTTTSNNRATVSSASGLAAGTLVAFAGCNTDLGLPDIFMIQGISGTTLYLDHTPQTAVTGAAITLLGVGFLGMMAQQSEFASCYTKENDVGWHLTCNDQGYSSTDLKFYGGRNEENRRCGVSIPSGREIAFYGTTIQHTQNGPELSIVQNATSATTLGSQSIGGASNITGFSVYIESGASGTVADQTVPHIANSKAAGVRLFDTRWPFIPAYWRRLAKSSGRLQVAGTYTNVNALPVNPNRASDFALIELLVGAGGDADVAGLYGPTNLPDPAKLAIMSDGTVPTNAAATLVNSGAEDSFRPGVRNWYGRTGAATVRTARATGDTGARISESVTGTITLGSGSGAGDTQYGRTAADTFGLGSGDSLKVDGTYNGGRLLLGTRQLWFDASGNLRCKNGTPTNDTDGTIISAAAVT